VVIDDLPRQSAPAPTADFPDDMTRLTATDLHKSFGPQSVLTGIDLDVPEGSLTAILGPSEAGRPPCSGSWPDSSVLIAVWSPSVTGWSKTAVTSSRPRSGHWLRPAGGRPLSPSDGGKNIAFGLSRRQRQDGRIARLVEMVGLTGLTDRYPHQLSGGQQQRVALARALAIEPEIVLLDEPFSSLDAGLRATVRADVQRVLRHAGTTALLVTHDQDEALSMADVVAVIREGRIGQSGTPQELYEHPVDPAMAEFLGDANLIRSSVDGALASTPLGVLPLRAGSTPMARPTMSVIMVRPEQVEIGPVARAPACLPASSIRSSTGTTRSSRWIPVEPPVWGPSWPGPMGAWPWPGTEVTVTIRGPVLAWPDEGPDETMAPALALSEPGRHQ